MRGKVAPEETIPLVVTLKASVHASFYSMELICKVGPAPERSWDGAHLPVLGCGVGPEIPRPERGRVQHLENLQASRSWSSLSLSWVTGIPAGTLKATPKGAAGVEG